MGKFRSSEFRLLQGVYMEAFVSPEEELGKIARRSRVMAGMGTRDDLAAVSGLPVQKIKSLEKGKTRDLSQEEVRLAFSHLGLNLESITHVDHLIQKIFVPPTQETIRTAQPLTWAERRLPASRL